MITINTPDDLLSFLRENQEFRDAVRRAILTEELLALPSVFTAFASEIRSDIKRLEDGQQELKDGQQRHTADIHQGRPAGTQRRPDGTRAQRGHTTDIQELKDGQQELKDGYQELIDGQRGHTTDIGELKGLGLEAKFYRRGPSLIATLLDVRRTQRVSVAETDANSQEFTSEIDKANDDGIITNAERRRVFDTDTIMKSARRGHPNPVYTVVESSYSLTRDDIQRVKTTATILGKVFPDAEIHTALYYMNIASFIEEEANQQGVHLMKAGNLT